MSAVRREAVLSSLVFELNSLLDSDIVEWAAFFSFLSTSGVSFGFVNIVLERFDTTFSDTTTKFSCL